MPKVIFTMPFAFYPDGYTRVEYAPGETDVSDECAKVAKEAGAVKATRPKANKAKSPPSSKAV